MAGKHADVANLLSSRADPHDYAFTPGDARKLSAAGIVVVNGLGLESWLPQWLRSDPQRTQGKLVTITDGLAEHLMTGVRPGLNPHVWLDPQLACIAVSNITAALQRIDPPGAASYRTNAEAYVARLQKLDADIRAGLAGITNRTIVTYHDAFPYFARRYNLEVAAVVEEVPETNPSPRHLSRLSQVIRDRNIRVLYVEPDSHSPIARRIAKDLNVQVAELDTIESGELTLDAYEKRMRKNLEVLRRTLR